MVVSIKNVSVGRNKISTPGRQDPTKMKKSWNYQASRFILSVLFYHEEHVAHENCLSSFMSVMFFMVLIWRHCNFMILAFGLI
jgi:hypothetical protein